MDTKDILKATETTKRLIQDAEYYKYIFKKTERIVSVVFYISYNIETNPKSSAHIEDIQHAARQTHDAILHSLETRTHVAEEVLRSCAHSLITLESKLRVAQVSGVVAPEVMTVLANEIDTVLRGMNKYLKSANAFDDMEYQIDTTKDTPARPTKSATTPSVSKPVVAQPSSNGGGTDRKERIKMVLEAKGDATIKDISEIITDCSEKTIQRELNAMIKDNEVKRHGERRWSRYTLF